MFSTRFLKYFLLALFLFSSVWAQDDIYEYKITSDTTIHGMILGEGNFFSNKTTSLFVANNSTIINKGTTNISILANDYSPEYKYVFGDNSYQIIKNIKIFDFNNDSLDEVLFAVSHNKIVSLYSFSSGKSKPEKLFELNNSFSKDLIIHITPVQFDDDAEYEFALTFGVRLEFKGEINGIIIYDFQTGKKLLETFSAEKYYQSRPISFNVNNSPIIVIPTSSSLYTSSNIFFSNSTYFYKSYKSDKIIPYKTFYTKINSAKVDTLANDFSSDRYSHIRAITKNNKILWEKHFEKGLRVSIDTITFSGRKKIILFVSDNKYNGNKRYTHIKVLDPLSGVVTDSISFSASYKESLFYQNKILSSFKDKSIVLLDNKFNILKKNSFQDNISLLQTKKIREDRIFIAQWGANSNFQYLSLIDEDLNIRFQQRCIGSIRTLKKTKRIFSYSYPKNSSTIYSIKSVPWFEQFSSKDLRNMVIAGLFIMVLFMVLWINTLRISTKKIKSQKTEIEKAHSELKNATDKLIRAEKLAVYGTIASGIAHEINSPLGAIINSAQRLKSNPSSNFEQNINLIEKAGKRSKKIVEKLLINTRERKENEVADVNSVLNDWKDISLKQYENLKIELITDISCTSPLKISPTELNQIFTNLLFNARDALMESESPVKKVFVFAYKKDAKCIITVKDTGPGFTDEKLENPFIAFDTTKEIGKGTGLGLWVVKSILDRINGRIEINNYEKGAEITIIIPIHDKENKK